MAKWTGCDSDHWPAEPEHPLPGLYGRRLQAPGAGEQTCTRIRGLEDGKNQDLLIAWDFGGELSWVAESE